MLFSRNARCFVYLDFGKSVSISFKCYGFGVDVDIGLIADCQPCGGIGMGTSVCPVGLGEGDRRFGKRKAENFLDLPIRKGDPSLPFFIEKLSERLVFLADLIGGEGRTGGVCGSVLRLLCTCFQGGNLAFQNLNPS